MKQKSKFILASYTAFAVIAFSLFSPVRLFKTTMLQIFQMSKSPFYATRKKSSSQVHLGKLYCTCRDHYFPVSAIKQNEGGHF